MTDITDLIIESTPDSDSISRKLLAHNDEDKMLIINQLKLDLKYFYDDPAKIILAFTEAYANAFHHGNNADSKKDINVHYSVTNREVRIEIQDEGSGFDIESVPHPGQPENLTKTSGRGLFLIHASMNEVTYERNPHKVIMVKT